MIPNNLILITGWDLDGAGCYYTLKTLAPKSNISTSTTSEKNFRAFFIQQYNPSLPIFVTSLDIADTNSDILDKPNVTLFLPHGISDGIRGLYKNATIFAAKATSCTKFVYDTCKDTSTVVFSPRQQLLIKLIDDYESWSLKTPLSLHLNIVYHAMSFNRYSEFYNAFKEGFNGFNKHQQELIRLQKLQYDEQYQQLVVHKATVTLDEKPYKIVCTFATFSIPETMSQVIKDQAADIGINIHLQSKTVSFRRSKECTYPVRQLAKTIADGGGRDAVAGGRVTDELLTFSKLFTV